MWGRQFDPGSSHTKDEGPFANAEGPFSCAGIIASMDSKDYELVKGEGRYEIRIGSDVAGFADYVDRDGVRTMPHTVVEPRYRGQGLSGPLIKFALDDARADGLKVNPACSAVAGYIEKHSEYSDLLA